MRSHPIVMSDDALQQRANWPLQSAAERGEFDLDQVGAPQNPH
jgi:hypothetical protein